MDLSNVPLEVLELILSHLTDPVSQRRLAQVRTITFPDQRNTEIVLISVLIPATPERALL